MSDLKCAGTSIVFQEVPNEVSLVFSISGCPHRCPDCHSKYLWKDFGAPMKEIFYKEFSKYESYISCVCFMEGTQNIEELKQYSSYARRRGKKVCLYTGSEIYDLPESFTAKYLDFIKTGPFIKKFGGLDKETTNQRFYRVENGKFVECTNLFRKKYEPLFS